MEREAKRLLAEVGLDHVPDAPVSTFSGGMKRRCSIAIACIGDVKVRGVWRALCTWLLPVLHRSGARLTMLCAAVALCALLNVQVLLLDEPTTGTSAGTVVSTWL